MSQSPSAGKPSALVDTRVVYCGDNLDQLRKLPDACVDLLYIDPPFNSNRNYEVFWGETREKCCHPDACTPYMDSSVMHKAMANEQVPHTGDPAR